MGGERVQHYARESSQTAATGKPQRQAVSVAPGGMGAIDVGMAREWEGVPDRCTILYTEQDSARGKRAYGTTSSVAVIWGVW